MAMTDLFWLARTKVRQERRGWSVTSKRLLKLKLEDTHEMKSTTTKQATAHWQEREKERVLVQKKYDAIVCWSANGIFCGAEKEHPVDGMAMVAFFWLERAISMARYILTTTWHYKLSFSLTARPFWVSNRTLCRFSSCSVSFVSFLGGQNKAKRSTNTNKRASCGELEKDDQVGAWNDPTRLCSAL